jgi:hypothetical protein
MMRRLKTADDKNLQTKRIVRLLLDSDVSNTFRVAGIDRPWNTATLADKADARMKLG